MKIFVVGMSFVFTVPHEIGNFIVSKKIPEPLQYKTHLKQVSEIQDLGTLSCLQLTFHNI